MRTKSNDKTIALALILFIIAAIVFFYHAYIDKLETECNEKIADIQIKMDVLDGKNAKLTQELTDMKTKYDDTLKELEKANMSLALAEEENKSLLYEIESLNDELKYYEEICGYLYNNHWNADYTEEDIKILAGVIYGEEYPSRYEMMLAGSVVLNRVIDPRFPNTVKEVVYQIEDGYEQYAPRTKRLIGSSEVTSMCYEMAEILLKHGPICPPYVLYQAHFNQGKIYWEYDGEQFCYKQADKDAYEEKLTQHPVE
jgi:hypothetical protein